jgi:cytochrome c-type biogenesis protein CcmH
MGALTRLAVVVLIAWTSSAAGQAPADVALETRLKTLENELRCLVCQNQTLAESNAPLAEDLRTEVRELAVAGKSDDDIRAYLVARYGDFVLYKPPMQPNTALLWFGPLALLVTGGAVWWVLIRRRRAAAANATISVDEEQRAKQLLES